MALITRGPDGGIALSALGTDGDGGDEDFSDEDFGELVSRLLPQRGAPVDGDGGWGELWAHVQARPIGATVALAPARELALAARLAQRVRRHPPGTPDRGGLS